MVVRNWPTDCFIPEDPCRLLLYSTDGLDTVELLLALEHHHGLDFGLEEESWNLLLGDLVDLILKKSKRRD